MQPYREKPDTRIDRVICLAGLLLALAAMVWPAWQVYKGANQNHTPEFVALAALLGLVLHLGWTLLVLSIRYTLVDGTLLLRQGLRRRRIPLDREVRLHRWRSRWIWHGGVQHDLLVPEVELFPPVWLGKQAWVLVYPVPDGFRAVALCPSPALLEEIREWVRDAHGLAV
ncbi:MAG TPA: hypothetical protein VGK74_20835 [Symbiobacteriaceae bacterium]|jgi:hypothetical protein